MTTISTASELRYSDFYGMMTLADFYKFEADVKAGRKTLADAYEIS